MVTLFGAENAIQAEVDRMVADPQFLFVAGQFEIAPNTQRLHWQGYVALDRSMRWRQAQQLVMAGCHIERRRGSHQEALDYVTKDETRAPGHQPVVIDRRRPEGAAGTWALIRDAVQGGVSDADLLRDFPGHFARCHNGINAMRQVVVPPRNSPPTVLWLCGPTGCGKTRLCRALSQGHTAYWKTPDQWWPGYSQQEVIIMDEISPDWMPLRTLLRVTDRYPLTVQVKGGHCQVNSPVILITAPGLPMEQYQCQLTEAQEIARRCCAVLSFCRRPAANEVGHEWRLEAYGGTRVAMHEIVVKRDVRLWVEDACRQIVVDTDEEETYWDT